MSLSFNNLRYERNDLDLFKKINGQVSAGNCLQIMGANGSGKTTLLKIFASLLEPHQGDVFWDSESIFKIKEEYIQTIQYIGHKNAIKCNLTVYENINFLSSLFKIPTKYQEINQIMDTIGLSTHHKTLAGHLSAGQMRRLCMAKLLLNAAPIWILDEPFTALDAAGQKWMVSLLNRHLEKNGIIIMATHHDLSTELLAPVKILHIQDGLSYGKH